MSNKLKWSEPKRVQTRDGPRILKTARPNANFWSIWADRKDEFRAKGFTVSRAASIARDFDTVRFSIVESNESSITRY